jgi:hypothetical protein
MAHTQDRARVEEERVRFQHALDEYLAALHSQSTTVLPEKKKALLGAYAEFHYQMHGGTKCTTCRTPVRHTMTVEVWRTDGTTSQYAALCTRCLEGQKANATRVTLRVGPVEYETMKPADGHPAVPPRPGRPAVA